MCQPGTVEKDVGHLYKGVSVLSSGAPGQTAISPGARRRHRPAPVLQPPPLSPSALPQSYRLLPARTNPRSVHMAGVGFLCSRVAANQRQRLMLNSILQKSISELAGAQPDTVWADAEPELPPSRGPARRSPVQGASPRHRAPSAALPAILVNARSVLKKPKWFLCYTFKGMLQF